MNHIYQRLSRGLLSKRFFRLMLASGLVILVAACGSSVSDGGSSSTNNTSTGSNNATASPTPTPAPTASAIAYISSTNANLAITGLGGRTQNQATITFRSTDATGAAVAGTNVTFSVNSGATSTPTLSQTSAITDASGDAKVIVTSSTTSGTFSIRATAGSLTADSETIAVSNRISNAISYTSISKEFLYYADDNGVDQATLIFNVKDLSGENVPGVTVNFTANDPGAIGVSLLNSSSTTDGSGNVRTVVRTGYHPGVFSVNATITNGPDTTGSPKTDLVTVESPDITVSSGYPVQGKGLSIGMNRNLPTSFGLIGFDNEINVILRDRLGNPVRNGTRVRFITPNCGVVTESCATTNGECTVTWNSDNNRGINNRCTLLAYTNGFEDFSDNNANGIFDTGDTFNAASQDVGEPFVDENGNNSWDSGEFFVDKVVINRSYTAGDGQWTSNGILVFSNQVFIQPTDSLSNSISFNPQPQQQGQTPPVITLSDANGERAKTIVITGLGDSNGNALPKGSTIELSGNGTISPGKITIGDRDLNPIDVTFTLTTDGTASTDELILKIDIAETENDPEFKWFLTDY